MIEMSVARGVVRSPQAPEGDVPLARDAFRKTPLEGLAGPDRVLAGRLAPASPRQAGAALEVAAAAAAMQPFLVEALSYLRAFEERYVSEDGPNERGRVDFDSHFRRYAFTLTLVRARAARFTAAAGRPLRVLDAGGPGVARAALAADPNVEMSATAGDLRGAFWTGPHEAYDLVLCTEVVEHVADPQDGYRGDPRHDFNAEVSGAGARHMLTRLRGVLAPDGVMLLTTPNALGLYALRELGQRRPAAIYRPHFREYTPRELLALLEDAGLAATVTTLEVYAFYEFASEIAYLERVGSPEVRRFWGDTTIASAWRRERGDADPERSAEHEAIVRAFARDELAEAVGLDALATDRLP